VTNPVDAVVTPGSVDGADTRMRRRFPSRLSPLAAKYLFAIVNGPAPLNTAIACASARLVMSFAAFSTSCTSVAIPR